MIKRHGFNTVVKRSYALFTPDSHQTSALPGWQGCRAVVLISAALGASFSQYLIAMDADGRGEGETDQHAWFFFLVSGAADVNGSSLSRGAFVSIPAGGHYLIRAIGDAGATLLVVRKGGAPSERSTRVFMGGQEESISESLLPSEPRARVKVLDASTSPLDRTVSLFTYDPGAAAAPFVHRQSIDYGVFFLEGSGVCQLDGEWHVVTAGDAMWIAPYTQYWFMAAGPERARFICSEGVPAHRDADEPKPGQLMSSPSGH